MRRFFYALDGAVERAPKQASSHLLAPCTRSTLGARRVPSNAHLSITFYRPVGPSEQSYIPFDAPTKRSKGDSWVRIAFFRMPTYPSRSTAPSVPRNRVISHLTSRWLLVVKFRLRRSEVCYASEVVCHRQKVKFCANAQSCG